MIYLETRRELITAAFPSCSDRVFALIEEAGEEWVKATAIMLLARLILSRYREHPLEPLLINEETVTWWKIDWDWSANEPAASAKLTKPEVDSRPNHDQELLDYACLLHLTGGLAVQRKRDATHGVLALWRVPSGEDDLVIVGDEEALESEPDAFTADYPVWTIGLDNEPITVRGPILRLIWPHGSATLSSGVGVEVMAQLRVWPLLVDEPERCAAFGLGLTILVSMEIEEGLWTFVPELSPADSAASEDGFGNTPRDALRAMARAARDDASHVREGHDSDVRFMQGNWAPGYTF